MTARLTGAGSGGPSRALAAGFGTFVVVAGAASLWMSGVASPPWVAPALLGLAGILGVAVGVLVHRTGGRAARAGSGADAPGAHPDGTDTSGRRPPALDRLQVDSRGRKRILPADSIDWIEAAGNYSRLHVGDESYLYRMTLGRLVDALDGSRFLRVHKSAAINLDAVADVDPMSTGDAMVRLASGAEVRMSRRYAREFHTRTGRAGTEASSEAPPS